MQTGHELLVHGLNDILNGEHQLLEPLQANADDSQTAEMKKGLREASQADRRAGGKA